MLLYRWTCTIVRIVGIIVFKALVVTVSDFKNIFLNCKLNELYKLLFIIIIICSIYWSYDIYLIVLYIHVWLSFATCWYSTLFYFYTIVVLVLYFVNRSLVYISQNVINYYWNLDKSLYTKTKFIKMFGI